MMENGFKIKQDKTLLLFLKYPLPGSVKTRLGKEIGMDTSCILYRRMVDYLLNHLKSSLQNQSLILCFSPIEKEALFRAWLGNTYSMIPQQGRDLGERIYHSFCQAFDRGAKKVVVIGSDVPDIPLSFIDSAWQALDKKDLVIGPALDGGYYLLALKKTSCHPNLFQDISWDTSSVFKETCRKAKELSFSYHILPPWRDIDRLEDIQSLPKEILKGLNL